MFSCLVRHAAPLSLALLTFSCSGDGGGGPAVNANEVAQTCQQSDYVPGQPRTASWVSLTKPEAEPDENDPDTFYYVVGHYLAMPLVPESYPYTVREIQYELGSAAEPPCAAAVPHQVQVFVGSSRVPSNQPSIEQTFMTEVEAGTLRTLVRHTVEPAITLEQGEVLFVAIEQPRGAGGFACPVACRVGDDIEQVAYRSTTTPEAVPLDGYAWQDMSTFGSYKSDPTVPWVSMTDAPYPRTVPDVAFDAPSDGTQDHCIAHIEYVDDARVKCTINHLCGDDGYRMACLSPTSCACAVNSEPTCPDGGEPPCPIEKPEGLCELSPREAEAVAIEACRW